MEASAYVSEINRLIRVFKAEQYEEVVSKCLQLIQEFPERKGAYLLLAELYTKQKRVYDVETILATGMEKTGDSIFQIPLGIARSKKGDHKGAVDLFLMVKDEKVKSSSYHFHLAKSLAQLGNIRQSIAAYQKCLSKQPKYRDALNNLANLYLKMEEYDEAIKYYTKLIEHYPEDALAFNNLASCCEKQGQFEQALTYYHLSIDKNPQLSVAYYNLGQLMATRFQDFTQALNIVTEGLDKGDDTYRKGLRFYQIIYRQHLMDWSEYDQDVKDLNTLLEDYLRDDDRGNLIITPYSLSYSKVDPMIFKQIAERYAKRVTENVKAKFDQLSYDHSVSKGKRKIGYYSPNFRLHPGGLLVRNLFSYHNSSQFEIHAFSLIHTEDFINKDIRDSVDYYHDVSKLTTREIADLINRTGIDILVSLAMYNSAMNVEVLALKPAPIQMCIVGSHLTTGAEFIDYVFSDEYMMDESYRKCFTEQVITLPCSLLLNSELPIDRSLKSSRTDHGLPEDKFVFASFNHPKKTDPETFSAWMHILREVQNSILWMYDGGVEEIRPTITRVAASMGISKERIRFAPKVDLKNHWDRIRHADLVLDSFIYNAHVTGVEVLRSGIPMVTLKGDNHNNSIGASLLYYSGLENLITMTKNDYIHAIIQLANAPAQLDEVRKKLVSDENKVLFDTEIQVKYLEKAFDKAMKRLKKKLPPKDMRVGSALNLRSFM